MNGKVRLRRLIVLASLFSMLAAAFMVPPSPAQAAFVRSQCVRRGPVLGDYVNVCVRLDERLVNGRHVIYGYGGMDAVGPHASRVYLQITALHTRAYFPVNGPERNPRQVAPYPPQGFDYIRGWAPGYYVSCGWGYKAVMSYRIIWANGQVTQATGFFTPSGSNRYSKC